MAKRGRRERGSGSIYKRGSGYVAQVQDGWKENGKPQYRQVKPQYRQVRCKSQADAVQALKELNSLLVQGKTIPVRGGHTVSSWLDVWLEEHIKVNREVKTYEFYRLMCE